VPDEEDIGAQLSAITVTPSDVAAAVTDAADDVAPAVVTETVELEIEDDEAADEAGVEPVFALAAAGPDDDDCAAAQVARIADERGVRYVFGPESSALRIDVAGLPRKGQTRTLAARVKVAALAPDATVVALGAWQPSNLCALALSPQQTYFLWGYGQDAHSATAVEPDVWVHLAMTYEDGTATLYVNGVVERRLPLALRTADGPLLIGGRRFQGEIADVHVWRRALSAEEIAALASATTGAGADERGEPGAAEAETGADADEHGEPGAAEADQPADSAE